MKRVAIWAAVSSLPQAKKVSLDDQLATGRAHAERHSAVIVAELVVPGESRDIVLFEEACRRIAAYEQLQGLINNRSIDVLIYLDRSRLGRTAALSMAVAELCNRAGILLYEMDSPPASMEFVQADHSHMLIGAIKSVDAQQEIRKIQDRHRRGMAGRVEKGKMPGKVNWGYVPQYEHGKLSGYAIDEDAAATIRLIVSLYLDNGYGALNIADHLNRLGRPAPEGGQWGHSQITFLLRRVWRYAGYAELNVYTKTNRPYIRAKGNWPAIITEEQARAVIAERDARNSTRRSVHTVYRFTRMVYCSVCGSRLHASTKRRDWLRDDGSSGHYESTYYRCPAEHVMIVENKITKAVTAFVIAIDEQPEFRAAWIDRPTIDNSAAIMTDIERINATIDRLTAGMAKADIDYYGRGALAEDAPRYQAIVSALKKQIAAAQAEITTLQDRLHDEERNSQREQRVDDITANTLRYLQMDDARTANAWLRVRFQITVEPKRVTDIQILF